MPESSVDIHTASVTMPSLDSPSFASKPRFRVLLGLATGLLTATLPAWNVAAQDYDREPILYAKSKSGDRVAQLIERLERGATRLDYEPRIGYLRSLLKELNVPESSQTLVFSKTSLQRHRIGPATPRALYFNDDTYVGFCRQGEVLELSAVDPQLGAVFYTLQRDEFLKPRLVRQGESCLICHGSSQTKDVPGYMIRSVYPDEEGLPIFSAGTHRVDHTTPLENRWGGWYVTGTHGAQQHLGNFLAKEVPRPDLVDNSAGMNLTNLERRFDATQYLSGHSDLVALMVLEHQAEGHNLITRANFQTRQALAYQQALNRELNEPADHVWDSTRSRIKSVCEPLVEYLLFSGEAPLTHAIAGTASFAADFSQHGPRDRRGRSLREFDLQRRLFRYPCSYLVYSPGFRGLPREASNYVVARLKSVLAGEDRSKKFDHLTADDRRAIQEILEDTVADMAERGPARAP